MHGVLSVLTLRVLALPLILRKQSTGLDLGQLSFRCMFRRLRLSLLCAGLILCWNASLRRIDMLPVHAWWRTNLAAFFLIYPKSGLVQSNQLVDLG